MCMYIYKLSFKLIDFLRESTSDKNSVYIVFLSDIKNPSTKWGQIVVQAQWENDVTSCCLKVVTQEISRQNDVVLQYL